MEFCDGLLNAVGAAIEAVVESDGKESIGDVIGDSITKSLLMPSRYQAILTPQQASRPCTDFTPDELLNLLNEYTGKNRKMDYKDRLEPTLQQVCNGAIPSDVGTIYSWFRFDAMGSTLGYDFLSVQKPEMIERPNISVSKSGARVIKSPESSFPARIWDLYSNRVVPFQWFLKRQTVAMIAGRMIGGLQFVAISHSWTADMVKNTKTPVNQYQYPVPLPKDIELEDIRLEVLKVSEYQCCWLDVVCNRQLYVDYDQRPLPGWEERYKENEDLRESEWATDLPLIGVIYEKSSEVLRYYNGLGRPFSSEGWECDRHWRNRVWTLQEVTCWEEKTGGIREGGEKFSLDMMCKNGEKYETAEELLKGSLIKRYARIPVKGILNMAAGEDRSDPWVSGVNRGLSWDEFQTCVREVNRRKCTNPHDRLIVLAYMSRCNPVPVYRGDLSIEEMFNVVWECLPSELQADIQKGIECKPGYQPTWKDILDRLDAHPKD